MYLKMKTGDFTNEEETLYARLYALDQVVLTPHIAGWTQESKYWLSKILLDKQPNSIVKFMEQVMNYLFMIIHKKKYRNTLSYLIQKLPLHTLISQKSRTNLDR